MNKISLNPSIHWLILFFLFAFGNALLAYAVLDLFFKALILGAMILLFFGIILGKVQLNELRRENLTQTEFRFPIWTGTLIASLAVFSRFFKLTTLRLWPNSDEALQGFFAIDLLDRWNWRFFYTSGQHPPMLIWLLNCFFHFFKTPSFNLWFLPALSSIFFVFLGYLTVRLFFSKIVAALYGCLLSLSFWPLYFGRFCVQGVLVPVFEMGTFLFLGLFLKSKATSSKALFAVGFGLLAGIGMWTYTSWISVIVFLFCLWIYGFKNRPKDFKFFTLSFLFLLIGSLPWTISVFREEFGGYVLGISILSGYFHWKEQLLTSLSYITNLFWGTLQSPVSYGSDWGGMLNPFLSSCFFIGVIGLYRERQKPVSKFLALAFGLFLLPGVLSADHVEMFRIIQLMPILFLIVALGLLKFITFWPKSWRKIILVVFLSGSFIFDFSHLLRTAFQPAINVRDENYWAYQKLEPVAQRLGPGLVFTDFILLDHNHTLNVACFPFNALENPVFDPSKAKWAGIVTNVHYTPFLFKRFPKSVWQPVTPYAVEDGGSVVGLIPITDQNRHIILQWAKVHAYFHQLAIQAENMMNNRREYQEAIRKLPDGYSLLNGDPFLESCYGEWSAQYHDVSGMDRNIQAIQRAIRKGYPTANLYYKLGNFYLLNGQRAEAKAAYLMAAKTKPNYTNVQDALSYLEKLH